MFKSLRRIADGLERLNQLMEAEMLASGQKPPPPSVKPTSMVPPRVELRYVDEEKAWEKEQLLEKARQEAERRALAKVGDHG